MNGAIALRTRSSLFLASTVTSVTICGCTPSLPDDLPGLIEQMAANDMNVHTESARKVQKLYGVSGLLEALQSPRPGARVQAARFLRLNPDLKARGALLHASYDTYPHARGRAAFALSIFSDPDVINRLVELQDDEESVVRYFATEALDIISERMEGPDETRAQTRLDPVEQLVETTFDALGLGERPNLPCPLHVVPDGPRLAVQSSAGVEFYSWQTESGEFLFSVLWGTKRYKSASEIKSSACALSAPSEVMSLLEYLATGERVVWVGAPDSKRDLAYPLGDVNATLRAHAKHADVTLVGGPEEPK